MYSLGLIGDPDTLSCRFLSIDQARYQCRPTCVCTIEVKLTHSSGCHGGSSRARALFRCPLDSLFEIFDRRPFRSGGVYQALWRLLPPADARAWDRHRYRLESLRPQGPLLLTAPSETHVWSRRNLRPTSSRPFASSHGRLNGNSRGLSLKAS